VPASRDAAPARRRALALLGLSYLGFVSLGLPDGLLGVAAPSIRASFGLPIEAFGSLLLAFTAGYLVSSVASGWLLARTNVGTLLAASCLATGLGLAGYAAAPVWPAVLVCGVVLGLGAGAIDAGINTHMAARHGPRTLNWLHAFYGLGAASGPLLMTAVLMDGRPWQQGYAWVAAAQLALALGFGLARRRFGEGEGPAAGSPSSAAAPASGRATLRLPAAWLGVGVFFVYTGLEAAAGLYAFALLTEARGLAAAAAGAITSGYWASLTVGRLAIGSVANRFSPAAIVRAAVAGIALGAAVAWLGRGTLAGASAFALLGLAMAPVFPTLIAATPSRLGAAHAANAVGFQIAGAVLGQSLLPALLGFGIAAAGLECVPLALLAGAIGLAGLHERLVAGALRRPTAAPERFAIGVSEGGAGA
jgi:fucose permease